MIVATPLDLPTIQPDSWETFWNIWNKFSKNLTKVKMNVDYSKSKLGQDNVWQGLDIYRIGEPRTSWAAPYYDIKQDLPNMYEQIKKLPIKYIYQVRILHSLIDVQSHTDDAKDTWAVRAILQCQDPDPQWYFTSCSEQTDTKKFLNMPSDTNWFSYNDKMCWHGSIYKQQYPKYLLQVFTYDNPIELVNSSIYKYKKYVVEL